MRESVFAGVLRRHEGLRDKREKEFLLWIISCRERSDKRNEILPVKFRTGLWGQEIKRESEDFCCTLLIQARKRHVAFKYRNI